ncbi:GNAT family N-acetyltransferase [Streptomyces montanisoli]|uniref:GNAT family N-acetyltransferase n=1 Tax=Streptomyces montanisoli TaxID=2798581 RepID=A0A940MEA7_9ACTN|nr:GNAT family N-acetyltransferase [Streptomyces montanisoli]MBP0461385.1 GNAT family N-acetyltransferase [Streptomyces montanisoli]
MTSRPHVRPITDADLPGVAKALVEVHATDGYPVEGVADPEAWVSSPAVLTAWVAVEDERVVGHIAIMRPLGEDAVALWRERSGETAERMGVLARLFVVREARKHATGETLMRTAMAYAEERSLRLVLDVMTKDTAAIRLYERLGWTNIGEATHHYGDGQETPAICYVWPAAGTADVMGAAARVR